MTAHQLKTAPPQAAPSAPAPLPPALEALAAEVRGYADLPPDWDARGGVAPARRAIENAVAFLRLLPPGARAPEASPRGDGGVGFGWDRYRYKGGAHLWMSFMPDGTWGWYGMAPEAGESDEDEVPFRPEKGTPETLRPWLEAVCAA